MNYLLEKYACSLEAENSIPWGCSRKWNQKRGLNKKQKKAHKAQRQARKNSR